MTSSWCSHPGQPWWVCRTLSRVSQRPRGLSERDETESASRWGKEVRRWRPWNDISERAAAERLALKLKKYNRDRLVFPESCTVRRNPAKSRLTTPSSAFFFLPVSRQVGVVLHYSSLSTMLWLGVTARNIYKQVTKKPPQSQDGDPPLPPKQPLLK